MRPFQNLLKLQIQEGRGAMETDGEPREVLIRRFFDLSMTTQTDTGGPTVVRRTADQKRAMEIPLRAWFQGLTGP